MTNRSNTGENRDLDSDNVSEEVDTTQKKVKVKVEILKNATDDSNDSYNTIDLPHTSNMSALSLTPYYYYASDSNSHLSIQ